MAWKWKGLLLAILAASFTFNLVQRYDAVRQCGVVGRRRLTRNIQQRSLMMTADEKEAELYRICDALVADHDAVDAADAALNEAKRTDREKYKNFQKAESKALDASNYDTIPNAQKYLVLLDKLEKAYEQYVNAVGEVAIAYENYCPVAEDLYGDDDADVMQLEEEAKEACDKYEDDVRKKEAMIEDIETKKDSVQAFISGLNGALNEVLSDKKWHAGGARRFRI